MSLRPAPCRRSPVAPLALAGLCLVVVSTGCGRDTDALICAPGRVVADGVCADASVLPDVACVGDVVTAPDHVTDGWADGPCVDWRDCAPDHFCGPPSPDGFGSCQARCDAAGACDGGMVCSPAGICLPDGGTLPGLAACGAGDVCAAGLACALEDGLCHVVCDPRTSDGCDEGQACAARPSGLGVCLELCD